MNLKSNLLAPLLILAFSLTGYGQNGNKHKQRKTRDLKKINAELVLQETPENMKGFGAFMLFDLGEARAEYSIDYQGFKLIRERTVRIKITSKEGLDWANVKVPFYQASSNSRENITRFTAVAYNIENGKLIKSNFQKRETLEEHIEGNWYQRIYAIPDVKVGSIIEYRYKITSDFFANVDTWYFQHEIPCEYSQFTFTYPNYFEYKSSLISNSVIVESKQFSATERSSDGRYEYTGLNYQWWTSNIPAFTDDRYIDSPLNYMSKLNIQLDLIAIPGTPHRRIIKSWPAFGKEMLNADYFGKWITKRLLHTPELDTLLNGSSSERDSVRAIFDYVQEMYTWNGVKTKYPSKDLKNIVATKSGTSADLNFLFLNLLKKAGLKAHPMISSTRKHGGITLQVPFKREYNYVMACIELRNETILADPARKWLSMNNIAPDCQNSYGVVLLPNEEPSFIDLQQFSNYEATKNSILEWADDAWQLTSTTKYTNLGAYEERKNYDSTACSSRFLKRESKLQHCQQRYLTDQHKPLLISSSCEIAHQKLGNQHVVNPFCEHFFPEEAFADTVREIPLTLFFPVQYLHTLTLNVTEDYKISSIPESVTWSNSPDVTFQLQTQQLSDQQAQFRLIVLVKKTKFEPHEYPELRDFALSLERLLNSRILLEKS